MWKGLQVSSMWCARNRLVSKGLFKMLNIIHIKGKRGTCCSLTQAFSMPCWYHYCLKAFEHLNHFSFSMSMAHSCHPLFVAQVLLFLIICFISKKVYLLHVWIPFPWIFFFKKRKLSALVIIWACYHFSTFI